MNLGLLKKIEGLQTVESISEILNLKRQSAINLISKLKKQGYLNLKQGSKKRVYLVKTTSAPKKEFEGMFDILNRYSLEKVIPPYDHAPHSHYRIENAIADLAEFDDIRILTTMLRLFDHVKNWSMLLSIARKNGTERKIGALYDIAILTTKVKKMPKKTRTAFLNSKINSNFKKTSDDFKYIEKIWKIRIPFNKKDLEAYKT